MTDHLERARESVRTASESADGETRENPLSLDEALGALLEQTGGAENPDDEEDRFEEVEEKLRGLRDETDDETEATLRRAEDHLDEYRRSRGLS